MLAGLLWSCGSEDTNTPEISFLSFSPKDTIESRQYLDIVIKLKDNDANTDSLFMNQIVVETQEVLSDINGKLPQSNFSLREADVTIKMYNGDIAGEASFSLLNKPFSYSTKFEIWVKDKSGATSKKIQTPVIYIRK